MILKPYHIIAVGQEVFLTQLHGCVWYPACLWIDQPDRFHWTKPQGVATTSGHLFDRQAAFKVLGILETVQRNLFRRHQRIVKPLVLLFSKRTVDVIIAAFTIASGF